MGLRKYSHPSGFSISVVFFFLLISVVSISGQQPAPDSRTVLLRVTAVDDHNYPINGLQQEQFSVFEKKVQLPITSFSAVNEPISVVFLFDVSSSVASTSSPSNADLAYRFARITNQSNDYMVIAFHSRAKVQCGWGCQGNELDKALTNIPRIVPGGATAFYDACDLAYDQLKTSKHQKQIIIVFTDGQDNASKTTFRKLRDTIRASSAVFYPIGRLSSSDVGSSLGMEGQGVLDELAASSGGKAYYPRKPEELTEIAEALAIELGKQYTISFNIAHSTHDNKWHAIKVKVAPTKDSRGKVPHVYLRYREGYYDR